MQVRAFLEAQLGIQNPEAIQLHQVEVGQTYAIVISTNSGLWRYRIGDLVEFTSVDPYKIKVAGRTKSFINAFGEEVIVDNADQAIQKACVATNAIFKDYTAAPIYFSRDGQGAHEWLIEFHEPPADMKRFTSVLDTSLQAVNTDYEAKRHKSIALSMPVVRKVPMDTFNNWLKLKGKLGGQNKVPRLKNDRSILEDILKSL